MNGFGYGNLLDLLGCFVTLSLLSVGGAITTVPEMHRYLVAQNPWLGFRPTLPDGLPVLGRSRKSARVLYAFGHQHIGLTLGGVSGAVVADLVAGRDPVMDLQAFSASRF